MAFKKEVALALGINAALRKPYSNYSVESVNEAFREQLKALAPDYNAFRRNKYEVFELLQEIFDEALPKRVLQNYGSLAEIKQVGHGQKVTFKKKVGKARAKTFVTRVGLGGVFETFRLDVSEFEISVDTIGGAAVLDFERMVAGQEDIAEYMDVLMEGMDEEIYKMICGAINATVSALRPENTVYTNSSFNATEFDKLITTVRMYGDPVIMCTPEFADTIPANYVAVQANGQTAIRISDTDVEDMRRYGVIKMYKGCPIVVLPQSFTDETNTEKVMDPSFCYITPSQNYKIARLVFEGGTQVDYFKNKDRSMELSVYQKVGVAILHNNNWAIYENTSLA